MGAGGGGFRDAELLMFGVSKALRGELRGVQLQISPHQFRVLLDGLLRSYARVAYRSGGLLAVFEEVALLQDPAGSMPLELLLADPSLLIAPPDLDALPPHPPHPHLISGFSLRPALV